MLLESHLVGRVPALTPVTFAETNLPDFTAVSFSVSPEASVISWQVLGTVWVADLTLLEQEYQLIVASGVGSPHQKTLFNLKVLETLALPEITGGLTSCARSSVGAPFPAFD